uniref:Calcyclin-binding protein n=1 Tax=Osmerus mordax TaxID=8014 RepID=C1BIZ4_OSMMO|nr:Calcyclin-binding protein [Osmerus mordax]
MKRIVKYLKMFTLFNAGWDQSDKFVKIYITLKGVHNVAPENVNVSFTERSFVALVKDLDGKNHQMTMNNLLCPIDVQESSKKVSGVLHLGQEILH